MDTDIAELTTRGKLVWMPAHLNAAMIGERKLSNGQRLSTIDWRANRLADALAKLAAKERQLPKASLRLIVSGTAAVKHAAMLLGRVTHAANNHLVTSIGRDGELHTKVTRDASQAPRCYKRKTDVKLQPAPPASFQKVIKAWSEPSRQVLPTASNPNRLHNGRVRAHMEACTMRRVDEIGSSVACSGRLGVAGDRVEQVRRRVRERLADAG